MARERGVFNFSANLEVLKNAPLDAREHVNTVLELTESATWLDSENKCWLYNNIVVTVAENNGMYMLVNYDPVTNPTAYSDADNWKRVDAAAATIEVVDNLESTDNTKALAASQGAALNRKIESIQSKLTSVYTYKGTKATYAELPTDAQIGDVWNVTDSYENVPAGTNWAKTETGWDALGGAVDLSQYSTTEQVESLITTKVEALDIDTLKQQVTSNSSAINTINGAVETEGSILHAIKEAKDYTDDQLTGYVQKQEGYGLIADEKLQLIDTNATDITALKESTEANTAAINIINGDANTEGSILNIVNNNINIALEWSTVE